MNRKQIEINVVGGDWKWLGWLTDDQLTKLCAYADKLSSDGWGV